MHALTDTVGYATCSGQLPAIDVQGCHPCISHRIWNIAFRTSCMSTSNLNRTATWGRYARELCAALLFIVALELAFYLGSDDSFSIVVFLKSVAEVFIAPLHPGWQHGFPTVILTVLLLALLFIRKQANPIVRPLLAVLTLIAWVVLGFATILHHYP